MSNTRHLKGRPPDTDADSGPCGDCGLPTTPEDGLWEYYMVTNETWLLAGMDTAHVPDDADRSAAGHHYLCIGCLEARLGRRLTPGDFTDAPVNSPGEVRWPRTTRLLNRLGY